jgi:hypothetical protein
MITGKSPKLIALALGLTSLMTVNAQSLAEFGSSASNLFTLAGDATVSWTPVQNSTGISISGTDQNGNQFGGSWASSWNLASNSGLQINITGMTPTPGSLFTVTLFDAGLSQNKAFEGSFAEAGVVGNNYSLSFKTETAPFTSIGGLTFTADGVGNALNVSVNNLSVVPEPSTYALMALGGLVLFCIARRRKAQQV